MSCDPGRSSRPLLNGILLQAQSGNDHGGQKNRRTLKDVMCALYLTEADVEKALAMKDAIEVVEAAMREWGSGGGTNNPRARVEIDDRVLNVLTAGVQSIHSFGLKAYTTFSD